VLIAFVCVAGHSQYAAIIHLKNIQRLLLPMEVHSVLCEVWTKLLYYKTLILVLNFPTLYAVSSLHLPEGKSAAWENSEL
jgi:hypothetical protein